MTAIAYLTDVEGIWEKIEDFARNNPLVRLHDERLVLAPGAIFVFGGDAIDRGPCSRQIVATLLDAKRRYGSRVVLLAGNRDINKMRLARELGDFPPSRAPRDVVALGRAALLRWIFDNTMGARRAFEMRRLELGQGGAQISDEDVVESFVADVSRDGAIAEYLAACQLAFRCERTLFVHGAVTDQSLGVVPGLSRSINGPDEWIAALNAFYERHVTYYLEGRGARDAEPAWAPLVAYQAPVPGTRLNQASIVYGRPADALGNPMLPPRTVIETLGRVGVERVIVGHTPSGDSPSILCDDGFQLVIADNSYGRVERGTQLSVDDEKLCVSARALLDDHQEVDVRVEMPALSALGPIGLRDAVTGSLVKGRLPPGDYLSFRFLEGYEVEQRALSPEACEKMRLVIPRE